MTNPITAWVDSIPDLPTDPTRRAMVIALKAVDQEISRKHATLYWASEERLTKVWSNLFAAQIALTDALFPPNGVAATRDPVPEWFVADMREKKQVCGRAMASEVNSIALVARVQYELLDELLQQATEVRS